MTYNQLQKKISKNEAKVKELHAKNKVLEAEYIEEHKPFPTPRVGVRVAVIIIDSHTNKRKRVAGRFQTWSICPSGIVYPVFLSSYWRLAKDDQVISMKVLHDGLLRPGDVISDLEPYDKTSYYKILEVKDGKYYCCTTSSIHGFSTSKEVSKVIDPNDTNYVYRYTASF